MYRLTGLPGWMRFFGYAPVAVAPGAPQAPMPCGWPQPAQAYGAPQDEGAFLKEQADFLKEQLKAVEGRLKELGDPDSGTEVRGE